MVFLADELFSALDHKRYPSECLQVPPDYNELFQICLKKYIGSRNYKTLLMCCRQVLEGC